MVAKVTNKGKGAKELSAGKMAVKPGPSGGMHGFQGAGTQKPGGTATNKGESSGKFAKGGKSGGMHGFSGVSAQKSGRTSQA